MPYETQTPLAAAFGAASGFLEGQQQAKRQKRDDQISDDDRRRAEAQFATQQAFKAKQLEFESARTETEKRRAAYEDGRNTIADRKSGVGVSPFDLGKPNPKATARDTARKYRDAATYYLGQGATDFATKYIELARQTETGNLAEANAAYTSGAKTDNTRARTKYIGTQDWAMRYEKPKEFYAKPAATEADNRRREGAKYKAHLESMHNAILRAGMRADHAGAGSQVALQKWAMGLNFNEAVRTTLDEYNKQFAESQQTQREHDVYGAANPGQPNPIIVMPSRKCPSCRKSRFRTASRKWCIRNRQHRRNQSRASSGSR